MIHIYTGDGKGKTTSAFGLAIRAAGQKKKVIIFQFLKPRSFISGEQVSVRKIKNIKLVNFDEVHPIFKRGRCLITKGCKDLKKAISRDFEEVKKSILSGKYDMVVLDEVINVVGQKFIDMRKFLSLLKSVPKKVELVLTGRGDIRDFEKYADYVTLMVEKKHPFRNSKKAMRKGIEY